MGDSGSRQEQEAETCVVGRGVGRSRRQVRGLQKGAVSRRQRHRLWILYAVDGVK